ncbi:class I SAM-dependent methyltransferase [Paenibacillus durus]|uniref:SAM-dependent methyltransferase n=1 Tax=Paenibacillus durus TaxID=44251 RepID=A0A089HLP7_PAEDU|nr:class I SAM-dependent methyltransferase [Paenibacillus durus]AIQ11308.1 SAM-dependent methyltransferase [Paenibacillus durus]
MQERINNYWTDRADDFSELRLHDFNSGLRGKYTEVIKEHLPKLDSPRVLDLGTGAGFFSFIMTDLGCSVTGIDYSSAMLEKAEANAANLGYTGIVFRQMDAQDLLFPDESFDFIITRNVTWTLPDPYKAYSEMCRVLAPGGGVLNFDANYGQTFKEADEKGEQLCHPTQTAEQLRERNAIAKSLYICEKTRPQWDAEVLLSLGMNYIEMDLDIIRRIRDEANTDARYSTISRSVTSSLFMVYARK